MSVPEYKKGQFVRSWDFECPSCGKLWDNHGDYMEQDESIEEECPGCEKMMVITASYSVDYDVVEKDGEKK